MAEESRASVSIRAFRGFSADADPHDRPPGLARLQVNAEGHDPGVLRSRKGFLALSFDTAVGSSSAFRSMTFYDPPHASFVVAELEDGTQLFLRNPQV